MPSLVDAYLYRQHASHRSHQVIPHGSSDLEADPMEGVECDADSDASVEGSYFEVTAISTYGTFTARSQMYIQ